MIIRQLKNNDVPQAMELKILCWTEELAGKAENTLELDEEVDFWTDWLNSPDEHNDIRAFIGAYEGNDLLGVAAASFIESKESPQDGIELNGLWVYPEHRGKGISLKMILYVLDVFIPLGSNRMVVYNPHFAPSNAFYAKFGGTVIDSEFQMDGRLPVDIIEFDCIDLKKRLEITLLRYAKTTVLIKPYEESDLGNLEQLDMFTALQIKYHGGVNAKNVFCAFENENITGAGLLTLFQDARAEIYTYANDASTKEILTDCLIKRFIELQRENNKMVLRICHSSDELEEIEFLLRKGFCADNAIMCMKYDLSKEIARHSIPDEIEIKPYEFSGGSISEYINAAEEARLFPLKDSADAWFRTGAPGFTCFTAIHKGKVIGSVTIFDISEDQGATEFIFTSPSYRQKNIARELIATALTELKTRGKKQASLTVFGTNSPAISLYLSMGYCLTGSIIEFKYRTSQ